MFIPYRVIQLKQKSKKYYKNADKNTILDTQQLLQNCQTKPLQKFDDCPSKQIYKTNISIQIKGDRKNSLRQQKTEDKNCSYKNIIMYDRNNETNMKLSWFEKINNKMKTKDSIKFNQTEYDISHVKRRYKNQLKTNKSMSISVQNKNKNQDKIIQQNVSQNLISFSLDLNKVNERAENISENKIKFKSIQLQRKQKPRPRTTHNKSTIKSQFQNSYNTIDNINYSLHQRSKSMSRTNPSMFENYMDQVKKKKIQKQMRMKGFAREREDTHSPIKITAFSIINNSKIANEQAKKMQQIYKNMRNCQQMHVTGRSINSLKMIKCLKNLNGSKCQCKQQAKTKKSNNCVFKIKNNDHQEIQIRAWKYSKNFDNFEAQQFI